MWLLTLLYFYLVILIEQYLTKYWTSILEFSGRFTTRTWLFSASSVTVLCVFLKSDCTRPWLLFGLVFDKLWFFDVQKWIPTLQAQAQPSIPINIGHSLIFLSPPFRSTERYWHRSTWLGRVKEWVKERVLRLLMFVIQIHVRTVVNVWERTEGSSTVNVKVGALFVLVTDRTLWGSLPYPDWEGGVKVTHSTTFGSGISTPVMVW